MTLDCILSDLHGESALNLIQQERNNVDRFIFLGDYGTPEVLREILNLLPPEKRIVLIGNYEFLHTQGKKLNQEDSFPNYWNDYPSEKKFILNIVKSEEYIKIINQEFAFTHGSLIDNEHGPGPIWGWINEGKTVQENFREMKNRGYRLLFRGHQHTSNIFSMRENEILETFPKYETEIDLSQDSHIVTIGSFCPRKYGPNKIRNYVLFDEKTNKIIFKKVI